MSPQQKQEAYRKQRLEAGAQRSTGFKNTYYDPQNTIAGARPVEAPSSGGFDALKFAGNLAGSIGGGVVDVVEGVGSYAKNTAVDIGSQAWTTMRLGYDYLGLRREQSKLAVGAERLREKQDQLHASYKRGDIDAIEYSDRLKQLSSANQEISKRSADIVTEADPGGRAWALAETAVNIMTLGRARTGLSYSPVELAKANFFKKGIVKASQQIETKVIAGGLGKGVATSGEVTLNRAFTYSALNPLLERNTAYFAKRSAQKLAGETDFQWAMREGRELTANLLIKRPLVYEWSIEDDATRIYADMAEGDYGSATKSAGWLAVQMLNGGPIGAISHVFKSISTQTKKLTGRHLNLIDELSKRIGNGNPNQIAEFIKTAEKNLPADEFRKVVNRLQVITEANLQASRNKVQLAADNVLSSYYQAGHDLSKLTPERLVQDMADWAEADILLGDLKKSKVFDKLGTPRELSDKYVVVRWDRTAKTSLAEAVEAAGDDPSAIRETIEELAHRPGVGWGNSTTLMDELENIIKISEKEVAQTGGELSKAVSKKIKAITTASQQAEGLPKSATKRLNQLGYVVAAPAGKRLTPVVDPERVAPLVSEFFEESTDVFQKGLPGVPMFEGVANILGRSGLSPESNNMLAYRKLSEQVGLALDETPAVKELFKGTKTSNKTGSVISNGSRVLRRLQNYTEAIPVKRAGKVASLGRAQGSAVQDIRQLTLDEITEAMTDRGVGGKIIRTINDDQAKAIRKAVVDGYLKTPLDYRSLGDTVVDVLYKVNPGYKYYSRAQSALRYTYNPFFSIQERFETASLSRMQAGKFMWGKSRAQLDGAVDTLTKNRILSGTLSGEAVQDAVLGRLTANIDQGQKRNLAGLALSMAKKRGMTLDELIVNHYDEVEDALKVVVQYPNEGVLSSSLARTLNLAFFPMRYNLKVTNLAARELAKQPPTIQYSVIRGLFDMSDWLESEEGIRWKSENSEAIQVLGWLTPVGSVTSTLKILGGKPESISDFGLLGGLPLGLITQVLDSQGIININTPFVNPKTGDVIPDYIPQSAMARASTALVDLIGMTFTYPGRTLGLPGKNKALRDFVSIFIETNGEDFEKNIDYDKLTSGQRAMIKVLKGDFSDETIDELYQHVDENGYIWPALPPLDLPFTNKTSQPKPLPQVEEPKSSRGGRGDTVARPIPGR